MLMNKLTALKRGLSESRESYKYFQGKLDAMYQLLEIDTTAR